jgi:large subunit ribosomal protein L22
MAYVCVGVPWLPEFSYSFMGYDPVIHVRASRREVAVSPKAAREICTAIRGKRLSQAKSFLEAVIEKKQAVPYRRYKNEVGHKSTISGFFAGRYPVKAAREVLVTLENLESNSDFKGLNTDRLIIVHATALRGRKIIGSTPRAMGRSSPSNNTLVHIELVGKEA